MERQIQTYLRQAASRDRETVRVGPFLATFTAHSANPYRNYAIPDDGAAPTPADIEALGAAFQQRARIPRLEYLPSVAPEVEPALLEAGFTVENRMPLMVFPQDTVPDLPVPEGIDLVIPTTDATMQALLTAQHEAYGEKPPDVAALERRQRFHAAGGIAVLAWETATGAPAGGGICDLPIAGVTELTSVGVRPQFRRRGIAAAVTARLTHEALSAAIPTVFLMAAGAAEARIYSRVGFVACGAVLAIAR
jgi:GNAT superfamily N-acetyltransferase